MQQVQGVNAMTVTNRNDFEVSPLFDHVKGQAQLRMSGC